MSGIPVGIFSHTLVDAHIYTRKPDGIAMAEYDHIPGLKEQLKRQPRDLPKLIIADWIQELDDIDNLIKNGSTEAVLDAFKLVGYDPHPTIKFKVAV